MPLRRVGNGYSVRSKPLAAQSTLPWFPSTRTGRSLPSAMRLQSNPAPGPDQRITSKFNRTAVIGFITPPIVARKGP